jgi:hypothetical protein
MELGYVGSPYPEAQLTTEHAASSYGQPVLVIGGEASRGLEVEVKTAWPQVRRLRPNRSAQRARAERTNVNTTNISVSEKHPRARGEGAETCPLWARFS